MEWRDLIAEAYLSAGRKVRPRFRPGASEAALSALERRLALPLPTSLRQLLQESDGVDEVFPDTPDDVFFEPVWSVDRMVARNLSIRTDDDVPAPGPNVDPLYFADAGVDGIHFAFWIGAEVREPGVSERGWRARARLGSARIGLWSEDLS